MIKINMLKDFDAYMKSVGMLEDREGLLESVSYLSLDESHILLALLLMQIKTGKAPSQQDFDEMVASYEALTQEIRETPGFFL